MDFQNKVVIVTGASSGIGASAALKFTKHGANVAIVGRNEKKLSGVMKKCSENGKPPLIILADVTNDDAIRKIVDETMKRYGRIDVLVNNAGRAAFDSILASDAIVAFDSLMALNLRAAVCLSHYALPHLIKTRGNIVNISSVSSFGILSSVNFSYNTSKAGMDHFTRSIALELASKGVRVNSVNPGPVKTDFIETITTDAEEQKKFWDRLSNSTALGRVSEPEEIADLIVYLAGDKAKSITGSSILIDNGMLLKGAIVD